MTVTKQTYTATATWTAAQLADIFRSAFIDAGLMADWFDSFLSGSIENRILRVQYDASKAYGTTFYWFQFDTYGPLLQLATGWNTSTHVPTGTQYLDYVTTTTNSANGWRLLNRDNASTAELVRYTSGADASQSWFVFKNFGLRKVFTIVSKDSALQPWLDLSKGSFPGFYHLRCHNGTSSNRRHGAVSFLQGPTLRRNLTTGSALNGSTSGSDYYDSSSEIIVMGYGASGNASQDYDSNIRVAFSANAPRNNDECRAGSILLPVNFSGTNPAFTSNSNPVFHSMPCTPYTVNPLPSDFGLTFHYATNSFSPGDTFVVSSGVEEWEVLDFAANTSTITGASPLFLARTV